MSTIKVNRIENTSTTNGGVSIDNDGHVTIDGQQLPTAGPLSNRNLLVNGSCKVAQRGTSTTTAVSGLTFVADRWRYEASTSSIVTTSQSTDAPPGFTHSIKAEITTTDTTTDATDFSQFLYKIEANDISHLNYGTADAQTCTISFWVKHSLSGTYPFSLQNHNGTRVYPSSYVVNNANTWEYKTITFAGDTGGTWVTDGNALGMRFTFMWNMGSNFTGGTDGAWVTAAPASYRNLTTTTGPDINGTVGNTVQWAGVQLEVGSKATPFEHRSYPDELRLCRRYFEKVGCNGVAASRNAYWSEYLVFVPYKETKRPRTPLLFTGSSVGNYQPGGGSGSIAARMVTTEGCLINTGSPNTNASFIPNYVNDGGAHFTVDAEL